jgi:hypothetical protein
MAGTDREARKSMTAIRLAKSAISVFKTGRIHGQPVTRNPIAWIPFFLAAAAALVVAVMFYLIVIALLPVIVLCACLAWRSFSRKAGLVSENGIYFPRAYGRCTVPWSQIREVIREREPTATFYRIVCSPEHGPSGGYLLSFTSDDSDFESTIRERGIPFRIHDWRDPAAARG